jgi:hypothetical protein
MRSLLSERGYNNIVYTNMGVHAPRYHDDCLFLYVLYIPAELVEKVGNLAVYFKHFMYP